MVQVKPLYRSEINIKSLCIACTVAHFFLTLRRWWVKFGCEVSTSKTVASMIHAFLSVENHLIFDASVQFDKTVVHFNT